MNWEIAGGTVAIVTLFWGVYTAHRGWSENNKIRRAEYIRSYTNDYYQSDTLPCLFLEIDARRFKFDQKSIGTPAEVDLARLLDFFNALGMAVQQKIIDLEDLRKTTIGYAALVTWRNPAVQWFLAHVDAQDTAESTGTEAFAYFRRLGQALDLRRPG